jgi:spore germination protein KC
MIYKNFNKIRLVLSVILIVLLLMASGCWDLKELDSRGFVSGFAIDKGPNNNQIVFTTQVIDPSQVASGKNSKAGGKPFFLVSSEGPTLFYAIRHLAQSSSRKLTYTHNQVIVFGDELARKGISDYLDLFMRDPEIRKTNLVLVAEGKGAEILKIITPLNPISGLYIEKLIKEQAISNSETMTITFLDFAQRVMSHSSAPLASLISIRSQGKEKQLHVTGTAVFDRDLKMIGKLNGLETRGLLWVLGKVESGIVLVKPGSCNDFYSLEIIKASSKVIPGMDKGEPHITIKIIVKSNLVEANCADDLLKPGIWKTMEKKQAEAIRGEILMSLRQARKLNSDIFGFGDAFYREYPDAWQEIGPRWQEIFSTIKVDIVIENQVKRPGLTIESFVNKKGD